MAETRINKAIFKWHVDLKGKKNIQILTMDFYNRIGMNHLSNITNEQVFSSITDDLKLVLSEHFEIIWFGKLTHESAMRGTSLNNKTDRKYKQSILTA